MAVKPTVPIESLILTIRRTRVILSADLAEIYGVPTKALNQAVKRNRDRFPVDFAFRLTKEEAEEVQRSRSQNVTLKRGQNIKYSPLALTEHGAVMAANVLNSPTAVQMSIWVVRAFLHFRAWLSSESDLAARLRRLERKIGEHDQDLKSIVHTIQQLLNPVAPPRKRIGFRES